MGKQRWQPQPLIDWDIFVFFSETAELNLTKFDRKLNVLHQVCVFQANRNTNMATMASDWLRHFQLLLCNHWMEFNKSWQEARSQHLLPSLCFSGLWTNQYGCPGIWLAETFKLFPFEQLNGILWNFTGSKYTILCLPGRSKTKITTIAYPSFKIAYCTGAWYVALWASCFK